jgi:hypothetical protein
MARGGGEIQPVDVDSNRSLPLQMTPADRVETRDSVATHATRLMRLHTRQDAAGLEPTDAIELKKL